jgi:hypothetical protein
MEHTGYTRQDHTIQVQRDYPHQDKSNVKLRTIQQHKLVYKTRTIY